MQISVFVQIDHKRTDVCVSRVICCDIAQYFRILSRFMSRDIVIMHN